MIKIKDCAFQDGSYPCGYKEGKLPDCELCHKIRKVSIKEVVEWLEGNTRYSVSSDFNNLYLEYEERALLSKLKEWGL